MRMSRPDLAGQTYDTVENKDQGHDGEVDLCHKVKIQPLARQIVVGKHTWYTR